MCANSSLAWPHSLFPLTRPTASLSLPNLLFQHHNIPTLTWPVPSHSLLCLTLKLNHKARPLVIEKVIYMETTLNIVVSKEYCNNLNKKCLGVMILNKAALLKTLFPSTFTLTGSYVLNFIVIRSVDFEKLL